MLDVLFGLIFFSVHILLRVTLSSVWTYVARTHSHFIFVILSFRHITTRPILLFLVQVVGHMRDCIWQLSEIESRRLDSRRVEMVRRSVGF